MWPKPILCVCVCVCFVLSFIGIDRSKRADQGRDVSRGADASSFVCVPERRPFVRGLPLTLGPRYCLRTTSVQGQRRPFTGESAPSYDADEHFLSSVSMPSHTRKCIYRWCRARGPPTPSCCASEHMRLLLLCSKFSHLFVSIP